MLSVTTIKTIGKLFGIKFIYENAATLSSTTAQPLLNSQTAHTTPTGNIPETPQQRTSLYNGQNVGSQWWPLLSGSTVAPESTAPLSKHPPPHNQT